MKRELLPRYTIDAFTDSDVWAETCECPNKEGNWVKWTDVQKLLFDEDLNIEVQNLRAENTRVTRIINNLTEVLKAEEVFQSFKFLK